MPPNPRQRFHALLASGRVANLPTVWSNVLVGSLLGYYSASRPTVVVYDIGPFIPVLLLGAFLASCLYVGGCLLGDARDASWDAQHRPDRPIPSGVLSASTVALLGYLLLALGWIGGCWFNSLGHLLRGTRSEMWFYFRQDPVGTILQTLSFHQIVLSTFLTLSILLYAFLHKRLGTGGPILMSLCRGLLIMWAAWLLFAPVGRGVAAPISLGVLPYALCVVVYTLVLSLVARNESNPDVKLPPLLLQFLFILPPLIASLFLAVPLIKHRSDILIPLLTAIAFFLAWSISSLLTLRRSVPAYVSHALAGFCLLDACFAPLAGWQIMVTCLLLFLAALLLQRLAPAT